MAAFYSVLISEVYVCLEMVRLSELHKSVDSLVQVHLVMIHFLIWQMQALRVYLLLGDHGIVTAPTKQKQG